jgi:frataxin
MDEAKFEVLAQRVLEKLAGILEESGDFDVELEGGVLTIDVDDVGTFLVNKHAPLQQLWYSSPLSGASHYDFDQSAAGWVSSRGEANFADMLTRDFAQGPGITLPALDLT